MNALGLCCREAEVQTTEVSGCCGLLVSSPVVLLEQARDNGREMPFLPQQWAVAPFPQPFRLGTTMQCGQELAYPVCRRPLPALLRLASRTLPACPRRSQPRAEGCCQVMVTQLENKCPAGSRGLGASGWVQPWVGGGEGALGRGFLYPWGETESPPTVEVVVASWQPWGHCWPTGIPRLQVGWGCADTGEGQSCPKHCQMLFRLCHAECGLGFL